MKKILMWILGLAVGLIILLVAAVIILPSFINVESYLPAIEEKVAEATGRTVDFGSDVDVSVFPWAGVSFNNLTLGNPEKFGGGEFVEVESFEARVKILPLLSRKIEIDKFVVVGPKVELVKLSDGSTNWTFESGEKKAEQPQTGQDGSGSSSTEETGGLQLSSLEVGEFAVTGGRIVYRDEALGQTKTVDDIIFKLADVSLERPIGLLFRANFDGKPLEMEGSLGPIGKEPGKGTVNIDLSVNVVQELALKLKGELIEPTTEKRFNMQVQIDSFSPRKLLEALEMPMPVETSDPAVLNSLAVDFRVEGSPAAVTVQESTVVLDDSTVTISANLSEMEKPSVAFRVDLDTMNIDRYLPPKKEQPAGTTETQPSESPEATGGAGTTAETSPQQPASIDYEPLRKLVLDGQVNVGELIASGAKVTNIAVQVKGRDGLFDLDPCRLDLYQGGLNVVGNFNVQGSDPVGTVDVDANNIKVGGLLQDSIKKEVIEGTMGMKADITFTGDTPEEIKQTLNGTGDVQFIDGALIGIDIADMARSFASGLGYTEPEKKPRTDFAELLVPFTLVNGVFRTQDTSLKSPLLRMQAMGTADLVSEKLDMKVRPKVVGTLKGQGDTEQRTGITVPIHVGGTFASPEYSADLSGLASRETLEEAVKDPESAEKKIKALEESGKGLLKGLGFGSKD